MGIGMPGAVSPNELQAAGLYDPGAPAAADRLQALELLIERGATVEELQEAGDLLGVLAARLAAQPGGLTLTRAELAERAGVSDETVRRLWLAIGFADPGPLVPIGSEEHAALFQGLDAAISFFGEDVAFQVARVVGAAMAKIADALVSAFVSNVGEAVQADASGLAVVELNLEGAAYLPFLDTAMQQLLRMHMVAAPRPNLTGAMGYDSQQLAVGFLDLVGSTGMAQHLSTRELGVVLTEFETQASDLVVDGGGRVVKLIGDELMFVGPELEAACKLALDLVDTFEGHATVPPVRVGLAFGEVLLRNGDCFGPIVNLAARAVKEAAPSEVLIDQAIQAALPDHFRVEAQSDRSLKGFEAPTPLARLTRTP